ncbi:MAG: hypothetical protein Q9Q40_15010, partial [Acidobacteriota bacterium]|nr:hypothetical protein [Acidobacteriota bacterium]
WYIGDADCHYAQAGQQVATLDSPQISGVPKGAVLTVRILRQVRQSAMDAVTVVRFRVLARKTSTNWASPPRPGTPWAPPGVTRRC